MANEYMRALAEHYRQHAAEGCHECGQSITPTNPKRGAWCAACEMQELDDGLDRDGRRATKEGRP